MDEFRVTSTSPYAQDPKRHHPDGGKKRRPHPSGEAPSGEDEIVLSDAEAAPADAEIVDTYTPSPRTED